MLDRVIEKAGGIKLRRLRLIEKKNVCGEFELVKKRMYVETMLLNFDKYEF